VPFAEIKVYDSQGKAVDPKDLSERLKKGRPVLVGPHRSVFSDQLLRLVKDDTLLIVVKAVQLGEKKEDAPATATPVPPRAQP